MPKIISLNDYDDYGARYNEGLQTAIDSLKDIDNTLNNMMIHLAVNGKWKEWDAKQSPGTVFEFTEEMLRNTGDKNIDALCELRDQLYATMHELERNQR